MIINESIVEDAALEWFGELGYSCLGAETLAPALAHGERESFGEVVLVGRFRDAIRRLNPAIPMDAQATITEMERVQASSEKTAT